MGAVLDVQSALLVPLAELTSLSGIYVDAPARAAFPYLVMTSTAERAWNSSGRPGRELQMELVLWDDQPLRLLGLEDAIEVQAGKAVLDGPMVISSIVFESKKRTRNPAGPWSCTLGLRIRLYAEVAEPQP